MPVSAGTATVKVDGGRAYTVKLVPAATLPTPSPTVKPCDGGASCPSRGFADVDHGATGWYHLAVDWAVTGGVTNGVDASHFGPNASCTRGQMVTFLWRAKGSPEPTRTTNPFVDVASDQYYYKPVLWAVENGITNGIDATHFAPENHCTRAQIVTFLWRDLTGGEQAAALAAPDDALACMIEKVPAPKCGQDDFVVFDLARSAAAEGRKLPDAYWAYLDEVRAKAAATKGRLDAADAKALAGTVLAVTALGYNAADVGGQDLTARLNERAFVTASGVDGPIWALLALDSGSYVSYCRTDFVQAILSAQSEDGSIGGSVTRTAMALQALTPYLAEPGVLTAVNHALLWLSDQQQPHGDDNVVDADYEVVDDK